MNLKKCHTTSSTPFASGGLTITCPACRGTINIAAAVETVVAQRTAEMEEKTSRFEADFAQREAALKKETSHLAAILKARETELKQQADDQIKKTIAAQAKNHQRELEALEAKNADLLKARNELIGSTGSLIQEGMQKTEARLLPQIQRLQEELNQAKLEASKRFKEGQHKVMAETAKTLEEMQGLLDDQRRKSMARDKAHADTLEKAIAEAEAEAERKVKQAERTAVNKAKAALEANLRNELEHEHAVAQREQENRIQALCSQIDDLKRKADTTPSNAKGIAAQDVLAESLEHVFVPQGDKVIPIKVGQKGSDFHLILPSAGPAKILIESKWTQGFETKWIAKAKQDQADSNADLVVIVTRTLPSGVEAITQIDDVWVCDPTVAIPLISALRQGLLKVESTRKAANLSSAQMANLRQFLAGPQFRAYVEGLVAIGAALNENIIKERTQHERVWAQNKQAFDLIIATGMNIWSGLDICCEGGLEPSSLLKPYLFPEGDEDKPVKARKRAA